MVQHVLHVVLGITVHHRISKRSSVEQDNGVRKVQHSAMTAPVDLNVAGRTVLQQSVHLAIMHPTLTKSHASSVPLALLVQTQVIPPKNVELVSCACCAIFYPKHFPLVLM